MNGIGMLDYVVFVDFRYLQMEHQQARIGQIIEFQCQIGEDFDGTVFDNHRRTDIATRRQAHTVRNRFSQIVCKFSDAIREPFLQVSRKYTAFSSAIRDGRGVCDRIKCTTHHTLLQNGQFLQYANIR